MDILNVQLGEIILWAIILFISLIIIRFVVQPYIAIKFYTKQDPINTISFFYPFLGIQHYLRYFQKNFNDSHELFKKVVRDNPDLKVIVSNLGSLPLLYFVDTKLVKEFSQTNVTVYSKKRLWKFLDLNFGNGVFFKERLDWREQRKMLGHAFHFNNLKSILPQILSTTKEFLDDLDKKVDINGSLDISVLKEFEKIIGEIILRGFFSLDLKASNIQGKSLTLIFAEAIQKIFIRSRNFLNFILCDIFGDYMAAKSLTKEDDKLKFDLEIIRAIGRKAIQDRYNSNESKPDFLQKYVDEMKKSEIAAKTDPKTYVIKEEDLVSQFMTFFFAGMDTTGHLIGMALYKLAKHPEYYDRMITEIEQNIKDDEDFKTKALDQCVFLSAFLKECLRQYPPAPIVFFRTANEDHKIGNFNIKKGTICTSAFTSIHNNPKFYKDPQIFNPDRWLDQSWTLSDQFAFIPFSSGQRNCIGQHLATMDSKIILIQFLRRYNLRLNQKVKFEMSCTLLYGPVNDYLVTISRKKQ